MGRAALLFAVPRSLEFTVADRGTRFYFAVPNRENAAREIRVVANWFQEARARLK